MEGEAGLRRGDLASDPLEQFRSWFAEAAAAVDAPEAMALATATPEGTPSVRMVLLKGFDERGLVFFSHYTSRKGRELEANPQAALLFHWRPLGRQVRVEGSVERVPAEASDAYFATRPRGAQLGALASRQSEPLESRAELEERVAQVERELRGRPGPAAADLGRLPPRPAGVGVLAAPRQPPARPLPLRARAVGRGRLADRPALPVTPTSRWQVPRRKRHGFLARLRRSAARRSSQAAPTETIHSTASSSGSGVTS